MTGITGKYSQYPFGFNTGISIRGLPVVNSHSNFVVWVDSNHGNDGNPGSVNLPFASVAGAINALNNTTQSPIGRIGNTLNGSIIMCKPYHAETLTAATTYSLASCAIIGVSTGDGDMPTFTLTTAAGAGIVLGSADMLIKNVKIIDNQGVTACIKLNAKGCVADNCKIFDGTSSFTTGILVNGGGANKADRCQVSNNMIVSAGATQAILMNEVDDKVVVAGNVMYGTYSTAIIQNPTATVMTNLALIANKGTSTTNNGATINIVSACTGIISGNNVNAAGTATKAVGSLVSTGDNTLATTAF
jgi:hypothetical protein